MKPDKNMRILVVDDSSVMRKIIVKFLNVMGLDKTIEAEDGLAALDIINLNTVDLILSDWCMPGMCGIELLKKIRKNPATKMIPFIMISAESQRHLLEQAYDNHVDHYIVKPFTLDILLHGINKVTGGSRFSGG